MEQDERMKLAKELYCKYKEAHVSYKDFIRNELEIKGFLNTKLFIVGMAASLATLKTSGQPFPPELVTFKNNMQSNKEIPANVAFIMGGYALERRQLDKDGKLSLSGPRRAKQLQEINQAWMTLWYEMQEEDLKCKLAEQP